MTTKNQSPADGLVGKAFHVFGESKAVDRQGHVVARVGTDHYLVQYFEWALGEPGTMAIVSITDMSSKPPTERHAGGWQFYEDVEHMNDWYEHKGKHLKEAA